MHVISSQVISVGSAAPGVVLTLTWYTYMCLPFGALFREGFSSQTKEPKLHKLGVFWANYCKKHPIWSKLGAFLLKMVYWWVGNLAKNWYRDSQIFEVRQAHPRTILVKEPPPPGVRLTQILRLLVFNMEYVAAKVVATAGGAARHSRMPPATGQWFWCYRPPLDIQKKNRIKHWIFSG